MKRLLTTTALGMLLVASPALAQTSQDTPPATEQSQPDSTTPSTPPAMQAPGSQTPGAQTPGASDSGSDMTRPDATSPDTAQTDDATRPDSARTAVLPSEMQASKLIGVAVENASGESIGQINDILLSEDGTANSVLIGVGGFLGLGQKNVAIDLSELNFKRDDSNNLSITVAMSAESLEAMPAYQDPNAQSETGAAAPMKSQERAPAGGTPGTPSTGAE